MLLEAGGKGVKAGGGGDDGGGEDDELAPSRLDIRVGKILSVEKVSYCYFIIIRTFTSLDNHCGT